MENEQREQASLCADIVSVLAEMNSGDYLIECGRQLQELVGSVRRTGKKGRLTMCLEVEVAGLSKDGLVNQIDIRPTVTLKEPTPGHGTSLFFLTEDGALTRKNPMQADLFREEMK